VPSTGEKREMNKYKGLLKQGNYWGIKYSLYGKQVWHNTGINFSEQTRSKAERYYLKYFGNEKKKLDTFQKQIAYDQKRKTQKEAKREKTRLSYFLSDFHQSKKDDPKISQATLKNYVRCVERFINQIGDLYLNQLTINDIKKFRDDLAKSMTCNGVDGILSRIKVFLNYIILRDQDNDFPKLHKIILNMSSLKIGIIKEKKLISDEDFKLMISFVDNDSEWGTFLTNYYLFAKNTGARLIECLKGEIRDNTWTFRGKRNKEHKVYLNKDQVHQWLVLNNKLKKDDDGLAEASAIKNLSLRVSKATTRACRQVLLYNNPDFLGTKGLLKQDVYNLSHKKIDKLGIRLLYVLFAKKLGCSVSKLTPSQKREAKTNNVSFHSIRHKAITDSVLKYGAERTQKIIGHSDLKTTMGYTHLNQFEISKEVRKIPN
jgi:site-specific recombinase XerD